MSNHATTKTILIVQCILIMLKKYEQQSNSEKLMIFQ